MTSTILPLETIYVFGHKNPDPDAICSAVAYAAFKNATGHPHYTAARCGDSNARIDYIFETFKHPLPILITDISPTVRDIMSNHVHKISLNASCAHALELIDANDIRSLPVVDDHNVLKGLVTVFDLGEHFLPTQKNYTTLRQVHTSVDCITKALGAKFLNRHEPHRIEDLFARVGSLDYQTFKERLVLKNTPVQHSIVIVGDREDIQVLAIESGVRLVVVTGSFEVSAEVLKLAAKHNVNLIQSHFDTATTAWVIRTASHVGSFARKIENLVMFSPEDKLHGAKRRVNESTHSSFPVVDENGMLMGIFTRSDLLKPVQRKIVLVDHNELGQAVNGAQDVNIIEIVDHHKLGNPMTSSPIFFYNEPVGSTSTIVASMFKREGLKPSPDLAGIMMSGLITDTLLLQSPTTTSTDKEILDWLSKISGVNPQHLAEKIFSSGSIILTSKPEQVVTADCKNYEEKGIRYSAAQVEEVGFDNYLKNADALYQALENYRVKESLRFSVLLVTDINTRNSYLVVAGDEDVLSFIKHQKLNHSTNVFDFPGIVSRKKQLIPYLTALIEKLSEL